MGEQDLLQRALEALQAQTGLQGQVIQSEVTDRGNHDARIELRRGSERVLFQVEIKATLRPSFLASVVDRMLHYRTGVPALLVSEKVSEPLAVSLRERGICFLDAAGNAFIEAPGWFILIGGQRKETEPAADRLSAAAWQVVYVLLRDEDAESLPVRALGDRAGVSHGAAASALHALDARGWIRNLGRRGQVIADREALLRGWQIGYADRLANRHLLTRARPIGTGSVSAWWESVQDRLGPKSAMVGGDLGAELLGLDIVAGGATLHVARWDADLMRDLKVLPAREGPFIIRSTFTPYSQDRQDPRRADPLLVLGELSLEVDERLDSARRELLARLLSTASRR